MQTKCHCGQRGNKKTEATSRHLSLHAVNTIVLTPCRGWGHKSLLKQLQGKVLASKDGDSRTSHTYARTHARSPTGGL